jgi:hypothetical protein
LHLSQIEMFDFAKKSNENKVMIFIIFLWILKLDEKFSKLGFLTC